MAISAFGLIFAQTELAKNKERLLTIISASASLLVLISLILFLIPEGRFPLRILPNNLLFTIPSSQWSPVGSSLSLLLFVLPLLAFWLKKLTNRINRQSPAESKKISLPAIFVFFFIIGAATAIYQLTKNRPQILDPYSSWVIAVESLKKTPLFGIGPNNFLTGFSLYRPPEFNSGQNWAMLFTSPVNFWLHLWTELGLVALGLWLVFCWQTIKSISKKNSLYYPLIILLIIQAVVPAKLPVIFLFLIISHQVREKKTFLIPEVKEVKKIAIGLALALVLPLGFVFSKALAAEYWFVESLRAINQNQGGEAYRLQQKAVVQNPSIFNYHLSRSQTNLALADAIAQKGKEMTDTDRNNISRLVQEAINEAKAAVSLEPQNIIAWQNLSQVYRKLINLAKGADQWTISSYQQSISLDPLNPTLRVDLGGVFYNLNKYEDASRSFEAAVRLKPDYANAWYNWAWALKKQNKLQPAVEKLQQSLTLISPNTPDYEKGAKELKEWKKELGKEEQKTSATKGTGQLAVPTPIPSPKIKPIELPKEAAPQIEVSPSPSPAQVTATPEAQSSPAPTGTPSETP